MWGESFAYRPYSTPDEARTDGRGDFHRGLQPQRGGYPIFDRLHPIHLLQRNPRFRHRQPSCRRIPAKAPSPMKLRARGIVFAEAALLQRGGLPVNFGATPITRASPWANAAPASGSNTLIGSPTGCQVGRTAEAVFAETGGLLRPETPPREPGKQVRSRSDAFSAPVPHGPTP